MRFTGTRPSHAANTGAPFRCRAHRVWCAFFRGIEITVLFSTGLVDCIGMFGSGASSDIVIGRGEGLGALVVLSDKAQDSAFEGAMVESG